LGKVIMSIYLAVGVAIMAQGTPVLQQHMIGGSGGRASLGMGTAHVSFGQGISGLTTLASENSVALAQVGYWQLFIEPDFTVTAAPVIQNAGILEVRIENAVAYLNYHLPASAQGRIQVLSANGRLLYTLWDGVFNTGKQEMTVDLKGLPTQASFVVIEMGSHRQVLQFHAYLRSLN
jgi:hypothetical protein